MKTCRNITFILLAVIGVYALGYRYFIRKGKTRSMDSLLVKVNPLSNSHRQWTDAMIYLYTPAMKLDKALSEKKRRQLYVGRWVAADGSEFHIAADGSAHLQFTDTTLRQQVRVNAGTDFPRDDVHGYASGAVQDRQYTAALSFSPVDRETLVVLVTCVDHSTAFTRRYIAYEHHQLRKDP